VFFDILSSTIENTNYSFGVFQHITLPLVFFDILSYTIENVIFCIFTLTRRVKGYTRFFGTRRVKGYTRFVRRV